MTALLAVFLAALQTPDYGKLLKDAKITLSEAIEKAAKEVPGGKVVSAYVEENDGKPRYFLYVAKDKKTVEMGIDIRDGTIAEKTTLEDDDSKVASAVKITLAKAIEVALKKAPGKAVYADFDVDEKGPPEAEVDIFAEGKVNKVFVHAATGEVIKTEQK